MQKRNSNCLCEVLRYLGVRWDLQQQKLPGIKNTRTDKTFQPISLITTITVQNWQLKLVFQYIIGALIKNNLKWCTTITSGTLCWNQWCTTTPNFCTQVMQICKQESSFCSIKENKLWRGIFSANDQMQWWEMVMKLPFNTPLSSDATSFFWCTALSFIRAAWDRSSKLALTL